MSKVILGAASIAVALGTLGAAPASAIRPCDATDVSCHRTCTLPQYEKSRGIYFNQC